MWILGISRAPDWTQYAEVLGPLSSDKHTLSFREMNFSVSTETVCSLELCSTQVATVPETGRKDTGVKLLLVELSKPDLLDSSTRSREW